MDKFHSDLPIEGDQDSPDRLNREKFSIRLAETLILSPESSSVVMSIEGMWGYGKSSVLNLVKKHLKSDKANKPVIFDFNPWLVGNARNLVQEFLVQFASAVGLSDRANKTQSAAKHLLAYSQIFADMKWVPGTEPWASLVEKAFKGTGSKSKLEELSIEQRKSSAIKALKSLNKPILVFVDDLDRLPPDEVFQMIRAVKAVSEFPRTVFILAFERQYVIEALSSHEINEPEKYLDKIIQVRLNLPKISIVDLHALAIEELNNLSDANLTQHFPGDQNRLGEIYSLCIKPIIKTPREIKRIFNRLYFIEKATRGEVAFTDLFGLETLAIKAPSVYEHIISNPGAYTGITPEIDPSFDKPDENIKIFQDDRNRELRKIDQPERSHIERLLKELFPLLAGTGFGQLSQTQYSQKGRIASSERLMIAISYGLPTEEVSTKDVKAFIEVPGQRAKLTNDYCTSEKLERFIGLIKKSLEKIMPEDPLEFIQHIGKMIELREFNELEAKPRDMFTLAPTRQCWIIVKEVLHGQAIKNSKKIILELVSDETIISLTSHITDECIRQHGRVTKEEEIPQDERWFEEAELNYLRDLWVDAASNAFKNKSFLESSDKTRVFFLMKQIARRLLPELISPLLKSNKDLDKLVQTFRGYGQDSRKGAYVKVEDDWLCAMGDIDLIRKRVKKRIKEGVKNTTSLAIYKSISTGKEYYTIDGSIRKSL